MTESAVRPEQVRADDLSVLLDDQRTLVEYLLDVEISGYPDWFVRAVLRGRQKGILRALDEGARR